MPHNQDAAKGAGQFDIPTGRVSCRNTTITTTNETGDRDPALYRGRLKTRVFGEDADIGAFRRILHEATELDATELGAFQWTANQDHPVLRPLVDDETTGCVGGTHTTRSHAHYQAGGQAEASPQR